MFQSNVFPNKNSINEHDPDLLESSFNNAIYLT